MVAVLLRTNSFTMYDTPTSCFNVLFKYTIQSITRYLFCHCPLPLFVQKKIKLLQEILN